MEWLTVISLWVLVGIALAAMHQWSSVTASRIQSLIGSRIQKRHCKRSGVPCNSHFGLDGGWGRCPPQKEAAEYGNNIMSQIAQ